MGLGVGLELGFCAKARSGDSPTAVVAVALRNPRRVALAGVMANDQLPCGGPDTEPPFLKPL